MAARLQVDGRAIEAFCRRHHIKRLSLFGSVLRDDFRPNSDVHVLVEFEPGARVGLIRLAGMERELSELLGHQVDLREPEELNAYFRRDVVDSAEVIYERG